jgi:hypothetical protein
MKRMMLMLMKFIHRQNNPDADERYLERSVDAHDLEIRTRALERRRPWFP